MSFKPNDVESSIVCLEKLAEFVSIYKTVSDNFFTSADNILGVPQQTMDQSQQINTTTTRQDENLIF